MVKLIILFTVTILCINVSNAKNSEEEVSFLNSVFKDDIPKKKRLIVKKDAQENIRRRGVMSRMVSAAVRASSVD